MFEQEILQQLKTKYKNLGLSETILKAKAKQLSKAVEKQEDIENAIAGVEDDLAIFQSFADQNRTLAKEIADLKKEKGAGNPEPTPNPNPEPPKPNPVPTGDEIPAWAQAIIDSNKTLSDSLTAIKEKETAQTNAQKLQTELDELKVSKSIQALIPAGLTFENDEAIKAYAAEMKTKSDAIAQEFGNAALGAAPKPLFGEEVKESGVSSGVQNYIKTKYNNETNN